MKIIFLLISLLLLSFPSSAQVIEKVDAHLFMIVANNGDTIHFLKTGSKLEDRKPTILFCQGSLPIPLVITDSISSFIPCLSNFDYRIISQNYNIVVISMPHTPPIIFEKHLNSRLEYVPDLCQPKSFDSLYLRDNYLDNYKYRANFVIEYLIKQAWVDPLKIAVLGHSQGSYVATLLAKYNPNIMALGYFSGNPNGRFTNFIRSCRRAVSSKEMTSVQAQESISQYYDLWKSYCDGVIPDGVIGDPAHTWVSFTIPLIEYFEKLKQPVFVAYGTADLDSSEGCDLLPIYFERVGKKNYKIMPYIGCGHNFEEISLDGISNYDKMHWDDAMNDFTRWLETLK